LSCLATGRKGEGTKIGEREKGGKEMGGGWWGWGGRGEVMRWMSKRSMNGFGWGGVGQSVREGMRSTTKRVGDVKLTLRRNIYMKSKAEDTGNEDTHQHIYNYMRRYWKTRYTPAQYRSFAGTTAPGHLHKKCVSLKDSVETV
jgi:hypothetical protein